MGERMDGWPLTWKREGRAGWREVALEIEEKKRGDVNLTEGMYLTSSASLERDMPAHGLLEMHRILFVSLVGGPLSQVGS